MKREMHTLCCIAMAALAALLSGCATLNDEVKTYVGRTRNEVVQVLGPPMEVRRDDKNSEILIWERLNGRYRAKIFLYVNRTTQKVYYYRWQERR